MAKKILLQKKADVIPNFDDVHEIIDIIEKSEIPQDDKLFYLLAIVDGCFTAELLEELMGKIKMASESLGKEIAELDEEIARLKTDIKQDDEKIVEAKVGAAGEVKQAIEHVEKKTFREVERLRKEAAEEKISKIKKTLKPNAQ